MQQHIYDFLSLPSCSQQHIFPVIDIESPYKSFRGPLFSEVGPNGRDQAYMLASNDGSRKLAHNSWWLLISLTSMEFPLSFFPFPPSITVFTCRFWENKGSTSSNFREIVDTFYTRKSPFISFCSSYKSNSFWISQWMGTEVRHSSEY